MISEEVGVVVGIALMLYAFYYIWFKKDYGED